MFKVFQFLQRAIKACNVFSSPVNLRYKLDTDYNTVAGGVSSIILILLLASVFFGSWVDLLNKNNITSSTEATREMDPSELAVNSDDFMFAIGITGMNLSDQTQKKYFDLKMSKYEAITINGSSKKNVTSVTLEPCTVHHWQQLGQEFVLTYQRQDLSKFLCIPRNTTINVSGKYTSEKFIYYKITFQKCVGKPNCRTQTQIDAWIAANMSYYFNFYYSNTLLNPDQKQPISKFFQDKDYTMFSPATATSTNLYLGEYQMSTDESLFPWSDYQEQKGYIIDRAQKQSWNYISTPTEAYCKLYLRKSNIKHEISRSFRKIDDMLSYIGGLFGIITVAVGFVMKYYGQCSFELQMCQHIFNYHNKKNPAPLSESHDSSRIHETEQDQINGDKSHADGWNHQNSVKQTQKVVEPKDFGFVDFFLHFLLYLPLKKIFNFKWKRMAIYSESLEEMRYKLDISQLMQKLTFYDRSIDALFDQDQLKLLYLQQKFNFQEVRQERSMLSLRKDIVANLFGLQTQMISNRTEGIKSRKKTLKEIAEGKSRLKIQTFVGAPSMNILDILGNLGFKKNQQQQNGDIMNLPPDIKSALNNLDAKIEEGDAISTRIYNGLQYELLQAFEKSKLNKNLLYFTTKKLRIGRVRSKSRDMFEEISNDDKKRQVCFADEIGNQSRTSIQPLRLKESSVNE